MNKTDIDALEAKGIEAVQLEMAKGLHGSPGSPVRAEVDAWIEAKRTAVDNRSSSKRDAREEETLSIAKEANRIASEALATARSSSASAKEQARWAMWAAIIAIVAAIIATMAYIKSP